MQDTVVEINTSPFWAYSMFSLLWAIFVMVTVGCHRGFLLKKSDIHQTKAFRWQAREWKILGWALLVGFIIGALSLIYSAWPRKK